MVEKVVKILQHAVSRSFKCLQLSNFGKVELLNCKTSQQKTATCLQHLNGLSRNPGQGHATVVQLLLENKADVSHSFDEAGHFDLLEMIRGVSLGHQKFDITRQDCSSVYRMYFYIQGLKCVSVT